MSTRTLNSTGRSRITQEMTNLQLEIDSNDPVLRVEWDLSKLELEPETLLYLDIQTEYIEKRFMLSEGSPLTGARSLNLAPELMSGVLKAWFVATILDSRGVRLIRAVSVPISFATATGDSTVESPILIVPKEGLTVPWELEVSGDLVEVRVPSQDGLWADYLKIAPSFKAALVGPIVQEICLLLLMNSGHASEGLREKWEPILRDFGLDLDADFDAGNIDDALIKSKQISRAFQEGRRVLDFLAIDMEESANR
jgi:hypothetical protein